MNASWNLQKGIYDALINNAQLESLIGAGHVYDHVPHNARFPYLTLGQSAVRDWSTGTEDGREHLLTLHVWSRAGGTRETLDIIAAVNEVLKDVPIELPGHVLVNLRFEYADARRDPDGETVHGILRYRAVTETVN
ncbi:MAG: DUF3168 domain-containing protein [Rhodobiaceae bacterium]|mgnify:CR=1 FL=1|nr:DUF3168 domain-containing protein [Rhodobiaceae bacterium]